MGKTLRLPPGFRFHPTDAELVKYYLKRKILGRKFFCDAIAEVDIYKHAPWDLPGKSCLKSRDLKWYFFCPREKKYACGERINRATKFGFWKTTGRDRPVVYNGETAGMIKTLVFHRGKPPKGDRTDWVMHEYRLDDKDLIGIQDSYVLCMIFKKEGPGPRNGAHYGAPFKEEEWTDNEEEMITEVGSSSKTSEPNLMVPTPRPSESCISGLVTPCPVVLLPDSSHAIGLNNSVASTSHAPGCRGVGSLSESYVSDVLAPSGHQPSPLLASNDDLGVDKLPSLSSDDVLLLLYNFEDGNPFELTENNKATNNVEQHHAVNGAPSPVGSDTFEGLDDLAALSNDGHFLELVDLGMPRPVDLSVNLGDDGIQFNQLSARFSSYPDSSAAGYQADMEAEESWFGAGNGTTQVNAVNPVQSMPPGRAFGTEDYQLNSYTSSAAPSNYSHSLPWPGIMYQNTQANSMYGSQNLPGWKT